MCVESLSHLPGERRERVFLFFSFFSSESFELLLSEGNSAAGGHRARPFFLSFVSVRILGVVER